MRKLWGLLAVAGMVVAVAVPAGAASEKIQAKAACLIAAVTWDGTEQIDAILDLATTTKPFPQLATSAKDKSLRRALAPLVDDPKDNDAARAFGRWCKSHFPKVSEIRTSPFTTPLTHDPVPADFSIALNVISKECFGSSGCVITYTPAVTYNALAPLDTTKSYTVVFDVAGAESPITANLTIKGTQVSYHNGVAQTADEGATLAATVTSVF